MKRPRDKKPRPKAHIDARPESLMMTFGYRPEWSQGAIKTPIFQTSTFVFESAEEGKEFFEYAYGLKERDPSRPMGLIYSRLNNPNLEILEEISGLRRELASLHGQESYGHHVIRRRMAEDHQQWNLGQLTMAAKIFHKGMVFWRGGIVSADKQIRHLCICAKNLCTLGDTKQMKSSTPPQLHLITNSGDVV